MNIQKAVSYTHLDVYKRQNKDYIQKMPKNLPVLFVSGEDDPVGDFGKGVKKVADMFKAVSYTHLICLRLQRLFLSLWER